MTDVALSSLTSARAKRAVLPDLVRSEWSKLRTVRSTYWSLLAAVAAMIGLGAIISAAQSSHQAALDPVSTRCRAV